MISELSVTISDGSGPQGTLQVIWDRYDGDRPGFQYRINSGLSDLDPLAYGHDLWLGAASEPNHVQAMGTLLAFLEAEAEKYSAAMRDPNPNSTSAESVQARTGDSYLFNERTAEWAYGVSDALSEARLELEEPER